MSELSDLYKEKKKCKSALSAVVSSRNYIRQASIEIEDATKISSYYKIDDKSADNEDISIQKKKIKMIDNELTSAKGKIESRISKIQKRIDELEDDDDD